MKKIGLLLVVLWGGMMLSAAEMPDFTKAETWKKAGWSKSVYTRSENGVLTIERTLPGSGAWYAVPFAVTPGKKLTGTVDIAYLNAEGKGVARLGYNFLNAEGKRVLFYNVASITSPNGGFETRKFSFKVPEGAAKVSIYICLDGIGKAEFRNVQIDE